MKIKMLVSTLLTLCLAFGLCACGNTSNTEDPSTAPATTVANNTEVTTTAPEETNSETETASTAEFTEEDALELVKNTYDFSEEYILLSDGIVDIDGTSYYAVNLRKSLETNTTYISSYFVTLDGAEIEEGYISGGVAVISDTKPTLNITEDNAVKAIEAAYDFEEGCFLTLRGTEEIDGVSYYAVDLRKSLETNVTYLSTYFITADGTIVEGYYENDTPVLVD